MISRSAVHMLYKENLCQNIDDDIDSALGLAVFYQCVRTAA